MAMFIYLSLPVMPLPLHPLTHAASLMAEFQWFTFYLVFHPVHYASSLLNPKMYMNTFLYVHY